MKRARIPVSRTLLLLLDADAAELEGAALRLQADRAFGRHLHRLLDHLAVARAPGAGAGDGDLQFVPAAGLEVFQIFVRADGRVIADLQLWAADEGAAVRPRGGAELQSQDEIPVEGLHGVQVAPPFLRV